MTPLAAITLGAPLGEPLGPFGDCCSDIFANPRRSALLYSAVPRLYDVKFVYCDLNLYLLGSNYMYERTSCEFVINSYWGNICNDKNIF